MSAENMIRETQSLVISVDRVERRESLIQSKETDEEEHVVFSYHIETLKKLIYWINKDVAAVKSTLFKIRKKNVELNDFYNAIINEKARYEIEYERLKKRVEELENQRENVDEHENSESLDVFVKFVGNESIKVDVFVMTTVSIVTLKKLSDSFILIDDKNSNIEDW
jgi:ribosome-binding ATPase YchF (GTP1/OBG family)